MIHASPVLGVYGLGWLPGVPRRGLVLRGNGCLWSGCWCGLEYGCFDFWSCLRG